MPAVLLNWNSRQAQLNIAVILPGTFGGKFIQLLPLFLLGKRINMKSSKEFGNFDFEPTGWSFFVATNELHEWIQNSGLS
jgi:hypothetical protein